MPFYQALKTVNCILTGLFVLGEVIYYTSTQLVGVFLGIIISCLGMYLLAQKPAKEIEIRKSTELYDIVNTTQSSPSRNL